MKRGPKNRKPNILLEARPKFTHKDKDYFLRLAVEKPKVVHPHITNEETLEERVKELAAHLYLLEYMFEGIPKLGDAVQEWNYHLFEKLEEILKHVEIARSGEVRRPILAGYFEEDRQVLEAILEEKPILSRFDRVEIDGVDSDFFEACSEKLAAEVDKVRHTGYNLYYALIEFERGLNFG